MKKQIKDLELWEVDSLVSKTFGLETFVRKDKDKYFCVAVDGDDCYSYSPTTTPSQSWPIIEREKIDIEFLTVKDCYATKGTFEGVGKTSLEAAMRCYLSSIYGDKVEI